MAEYATEQKLFRFVTRSTEIETQQHNWGTISWHDSAELTGSETLTVGIVEIHAGKSNPVHQHPNCDEVLYLLTGKLIHSIGDTESVEMEPGDLIHIPKGVKHAARSVGDVAAKMLVAYNTGRREVVGEV